MGQRDQQGWRQSRAEDCVPGTDRETGLETDWGRGMCPWNRQSDGAGDSMGKGDVSVGQTDGTGYRVREVHVSVGQTDGAGDRVG